MERVVDPAATSVRLRVLSAESIAFLIMLAAMVAAPAIAYPVFLMKALCFALFACAFNLLLGYTGLLSFGHAAFFGVAAYVTGWLAKSAGWTPELAIAGSVAVSAMLGAVVGSLAIRRRGIYFAMITLGIAQMIFFLCVQAPFTGGEDGLQGVPRGKLFGVRCDDGVIRFLQSFQNALADSAADACDENLFPSRCHARRF